MRSRKLVLGCVGFAAVTVAGVAVWVGVRVQQTTAGVAGGITDRVDRGVAKVEKLLDRGEHLPEMSREQAAAWEVPAEGVVLTVGQRSAAWLPGGKYRLHVGDITGGQVMVSVTDEAGRVVVAGRSVKVGGLIQVGEGESERWVAVKKLKNLLAGGDFGEFRVRAGSGR